MKIEDWFNLARRGLETIQDLVNKSNKMNEKVIETIDTIGENMSKQWLETHSIASKQVENALAYQSKLINTQYDVKSIKFKYKFKIFFLIFI